MARQGMGLFGKLATLGAVGAAAGFTWRWAQRHRAAGTAGPRDLTRWEGEGGAVTNASDSEGAPPNGMSAAAMSARPDVDESTGSKAPDAWPFPQSTRH